MVLATTTCRVQRMARSGHMTFGLQTSVPVARIVARPTFAARRTALSTPTEFREIDVTLTTLDVLVGTLQRNPVRRFSRASPASRISTTHGILDSMRTDGFNTMSQVDCAVVA